MGHHSLVIICTGWSFLDVLIGIKWDISESELKSISNDFDNYYLDYSELPGFKAAYDP